MTCYVFGAGEYPEARILPEPGDFVIAADGGLAACRQWGITPQILVGDFDSFAADCAEQNTGIPAGTEVVRLPVEKDVTDMAAALELGRARGAKRFVMLGGTGGRPDHTYANYQLLAAMAQRGEEGYLVGAAFSATAIIGGSALTFSSDFSGTLSVFSLTDEARGVEESGVKYPLADATLSATVPLGVSNSFLGGEDGGARVAVAQGTLLVMWEGQRLPTVVRVSLEKST